MTNLKGHVYGVNLFLNRENWFRTGIKQVLSLRSTGSRQRAPFPEAERLPAEGGVGRQGSGGQGPQDPQGPQDRDPGRRENGQPDRQGLQGEQSLSPFFRAHLFKVAIFTIQI